MFFWQVQICNSQASTMDICFFCHQTPIPRFIRTCCPTFLELCKDTPRKQCTIPWEKKKCQGIVFCECWLPFLLLWLGTVRWLPSKKSEACFLFQKTQNHDQRRGWNEKENEEVCFSGKYEAETTQISLGEYTSFAIRPQCPGSQKHVSLQFQSCVRHF